jgi:hypothetical protein
MLWRQHLKLINSALICHHCRPLPFLEWPPPTSPLVQKVLIALATPYLLVFFAPARYMVVKIACSYSEVVL